MYNLNLSNIELYYSASCDLDSQMITIEGDECNHILSVMRHRVNDEIYVTNGFGKIFTSQIVQINKKNVTAKILKEFRFDEGFPNITFCIPMLRNNERFEFALEKCTELGVTNFFIYKAKRSVPKKVNQLRVEKILAAAMKQSLLSWLPKVKYINSLNELVLMKGEKIIFEQNSEVYFSPEKIKKGMDYLFIFGPEGDFTSDELNSLRSSIKYKLAENRLRTETAVIKAASLL
jgi:16S rRNA (uracil1498-N3)-methyltransferase